MSPPSTGPTYLLVFEQTPIKHERLGFAPLPNALHIHLDKGEFELEGSLSLERYRGHILLRFFLYAVAIIIRRRGIFLFLHFLVLFDKPICGAIEAIHSYAISIAVDGTVDQTVLWDEHHLLVMIFFFLLLFPAHPGLVVVIILVFWNRVAAPCHTKAEFEILDQILGLIVNLVLEFESARKECRNVVYPRRRSRSYLLKWWRNCHVGYPPPFPFLEFRWIAIKR